MDRHDVATDTDILRVVDSPAPSFNDTPRIGRRIPPPVAREFRAAWIATVANIDWPSKPGLSPQQQKDELRNLLTQARFLRLNAVVLQVRPACDAIYPSSLEPWSEYLTGTMGQPPEPFYDPLKFAIQEAHARGLELHAWFNPYRAHHPSAKSPISADHVSQVKPEIVREYGKHLWLDPAEPLAAEHSFDVIMDVVNRYDVDGIHFDDYFYPYPVNDDQGKPIPFPDERSWQARADEDKSLSRDDWRRAAVNRLVARLYGEIKATKPHVKFGISPFGIYRPGNPPQIKGFDQFATLYADPLKWWHDGNVDYLTPQLYWKIGPPDQSFPALLHWWHQENKQQRHLWPGHFTSRLLSSGQGGWNVEELIAQIWVTRAQPGATGNVHFSMKALTKEAGSHGLEIRKHAYRQPALVPESNWLAGDAPRPSKPVLSHTSIANKGHHVTWEGGQGPFAVGCAVTTR